MRRKKLRPETYDFAADWGITLSDFPLSLWDRRVITTLLPGQTAGIRVSIPDPRTLLFHSQFLERVRFRDLIFRENKLCDRFHFVFQLRLIVIQYFRQSIHDYVRPI